MDINIFSNGIAVEGLNILLTFTIELSEPTLVPITYYWSTLNNTAVGGSDFTAVTNQAIAFSAGERFKAIAVTITNDLINELDESFFVNVFSTNNVATAVLLASTLGTITDVLTSDVTTTLTATATVESLTLTGTAAINGIGNISDNTILGNSGNNILDGGSGNDNLIGGAGNDTLLGGVGNDTLDGGAGTDSLNGGGGDDTYIITDALDIITGELSSNGTDTIQTSINNYTLSPVLPQLVIENLTLTGAAINGTGNELNNLIKGNDLANNLKGLDGADTLQGNSGNDTLEGGADNDVLDGGAGTDSLIGGQGNDIYVIDSPSDIINENANANEGIDTVQVGYASYTLTNANLENITLMGVLAINATGNAQDNILIGNNSNNILDGGAGNDILDGNGGVDTLRGGAGNDTYILDNPGDVVDLVLENATGGIDTINVNADYTLGANLERLALLGNGNFSGIGNALANNLTGNLGNNYLDGKEGPDNMAGGAGDDIYVLNEQGDTVTESTGQGNDTVIVGYNTTSQAYVLSANVENVTLTGDASNVKGNESANILLGSDNSDRLEGAGGNDTLDGGKGNDILMGGAGNDLYRVSYNDLDTIQEAASGGNDTVEVYFSDFPLNYQLPDNVENLIFLWGPGANTPASPSVAGATMTGTIANDFVSASNSNDLINGNAGNDSVNAFAGNDTINGGTGDDTLLGGNDNDVINGDDGKDILDGGSGIDSLTGGIGDDTYFTDTTSDVLTEADSAGTDEVKSTVSYLLKTNFENLTLLGGTNINATGNTVNNVIFGNTGNNTLDGQDGNDSLNGNSGSDVLLGQVGNDTLDGGTGIDTLYGGVGDDTYVVDNIADVVIEGLNEGTDLINTSVSYTLSDNVENLTLTGTTAINGIGNSLNNIITGNSGTNVIDGGLGNDTMIGGLGNDIYYVNSVSDVIVEDLILNSGIDTVLTTVNGYTLAANLENLTLIGSATTGTGNALANRLTGNNANNTLNGGDGNDVLDGLAGNDTLVGGLGDDKYIVDSASDIVIENGVVGSGTDSVFASINYTLSANVENLALSGIANINGTGSVNNNTISGNSGNNRLDGNAGNDTLIGNEGNDVLVGGAGDDILTGGLGADIFEYKTSSLYSGSAIGKDDIKDFNRVQGDKILFGKVTFALTSAVGSPLTSTEFASVTLDSLIATSAAKIVHSQQSGNIYYNSNGSAIGGDSWLVTTNIVGAALLTSDFVVG